MRLATTFLRQTLSTLAIAAAVMFFMLLGPGIHAQAPPAGEQRTPTVNLTVEQRHMIKELLKEFKVEPISTAAPTTIGETVPERVTVQPIPVEVAQRVPQVRSHSYYIKDEHIVLVDPKDRKIADVIN